MAIVESFKRESMYGLSAKKSGRYGGVAVSERFNCSTLNNYPSGKRSWLISFKNASHIPIWLVLRIDLKFQLWFPKFASWNLGIVSNPSRSKRNFFCRRKKSLWSLHRYPRVTHLFHFHHIVVSFFWPDFVHFFPGGTTCSCSSKCWHRRRACSKKNDT